MLGSKKIQMWDIFRREGLLVGCHRLFITALARFETSEAHPSSMTNNAPPHLHPQIASNQTQFKISYNASVKMPG
jgi:hypothetical protein